MSLSASQREAWLRDGFLHLPGFFGDGSQLAEWTDELSCWPETAGKWMKYFESSVDGRASRMLCRVENFLEHHSGWRGIIEDARLAEVLADLFEEPAVLFKEKINFKLPGGNGFTAHQDAPAFSAFGQSFHITAMVSIDAATVENGCLDMAVGQHVGGLLAMTEAQVLSKKSVEALDWAPLETGSGDLVLFGSFIPHRSGPNRSDVARRAAYITYNAASLGSRRADYYAEKRRVFPPEIERVTGRDYSDSGLYNIGNPIRD
jgi:ectoine hydroxylase-related dioxygenase (phytanoyl-CoA dioxygenase family)